MSNKKINNANLFKALGIFIETIRPYIITLLKNLSGENWSKRYYDTLSYPQQKNWDIAIKNGAQPETLIDFHNLKGFAIGCKELLMGDFKKARSLPTWFEDIAEARNKCQHFDTSLTQEEVSRAYVHMIIMMTELEHKEVVEEITALRDQKDTKAKIKVKVQKTATKVSKGLTPWFSNVLPHMDIRQGNLDESVFAANLAEVAMGSGREIYRNPGIFFSKTYFTAGLKTVAKRVIKGLNGGEDAENRVVSLQTGFGGGKTHLLISLYHLVKQGKNMTSSVDAEELLEFTGLPKFDSANVAVFTNTTNDPTQGRLDEEHNVHIQTLWGEIAWQLGGEKTYNYIKANDENRTAPKGLFKEILAQSKPALILIDELSDYCVAASGVTVGNSSLADQTISFIQELSEAVSATDNCVLVATLPASVVEVATSDKASQILTSLSSRFSRVGADTTPVADEEIFEVIRRRLFEELGDPAVMEKTISSYTSLYQEMVLSAEIPSHAANSEYKKLLTKAYPFHPELIDMFRVRWASTHDFQRTRGVLRILASIVSDLWKRQGSLTGVNALIHTSDINFENLDALSSQLKKLYGNGYDAVITADVSGSSSNAFKIDNEKKEYGNYSLTRGISATILLGSFGSTSANKGLDIKELKLCALKPDSFNHNSINGAIDIMEDQSHYLYYTSIGSTTKRYWFHTKPNINILINQAKSDIKSVDLNSEILERINKKAKNIDRFNVLINPSEDVPEQTKLTLIILGPEYLANVDSINGKTKKLIAKIATKKGKGERIYRNTILFLLCSEVGITGLYNHLSDYKACVKIKEDYQGQLEKEQKDEINKKINEFDQKSNYALAAAYSILVKYSAKDKNVDKILVKQHKDMNLNDHININVIQLLKTEEWLLDSIGLGTLRTNNLLPRPDQPIQTKAIYEAFLQFDDKPMIIEKSAVQTSILRYCKEGEFAIASGDGANFNEIYYKEPVSLFDVTDSIFWLVDKSLYQPKQSEVAVLPKTSEAGAIIPVNDKNKPYEPVTTPDSPKPDNALPLEKRFRSITISGNVNVENYNQLFSSFILPLSKNNVEIKIEIKGKSTEANPISETSDQYKIAKESAKQLSLNFEEELS